MLSLSGTLIRLYRKKNGLASVKLKSYLMVDAANPFSINRYLKDISMHLELASGEHVYFDEIIISETSMCYEMGVMIYDFSASSVIDLTEMRNTVGRLFVNYHLCFTGHSTEEPETMNIIVPVIKKATIYDR